RCPPAPAGTYFVRVRAGNASTIGGASNEATLVVGSSTTCVVPPAPPGELRSSVTGSTVTLSWAAASGAPTSYVIEAGSSIALSDLLLSDTGSQATSFTATGVAPGTYFVRLRAHNGCGKSLTSNEVEVVVR